MTVVFTAGTTSSISTQGPTQQVRIYVNGGDATNNGNNPWNSQTGNPATISTAPPFNDVARNYAWVGLSQGKSDPMFSGSIAEVVSARPRLSSRSDDTRFFWARLSGKLSWLLSAHGVATSSLRISPRMLIPVAFDG